MSLLKTAISINKSMIDEFQDKLDNIIIEAMQPIWAFLSTSRFTRFHLSDQRVKMQACLR